jgi:UDP-GlcNAc3NAcA epimerase
MTARETGRIDHSGKGWNPTVRSSQVSIGSGERLRLVTVTGTRAEAIKEAALTRALRRDHDEFLVDTGEDGMSRAFYEELGVSPEFPMQLGTGSMVAAVQEHLGALLSEHRPDLVVVLGDTATTLAAARAACAVGLPVAHVEAGMRSFDPEQPEESRRIEVDELSELRFCSTPTAVENLGDVGIEQGVYLVGDVSVDAALVFRQQAHQRSTILEDLGLEPGGYLLVTAHRDNLKAPGRLERLVELLAGLPAPAVFPVHPMTDRLLRERGLRERLEQIDGLRLLQPVGYLDTLRLTDNALAVLSDSGPLTKDAVLCGKRYLTLRDRNEWRTPELADVIDLVDLDLEAVARALNKPAPADRDRSELWGGGHAADRISEQLAAWAASR